MPRLCAVAVAVMVLLAKAGQAAPTDVDIVLQAHSLPPLTAEVMHAEVARIWAREGIAVSWTAREDQVPASHAFVRLMFLEGPSMPARGALPTLGQFLPEEQRIRVSLPAVDKVARTAAASTSRGYQVALGYVLGRVVAHELGHALLGTAHSTDGLMIASFDPTAVGDARSDRFHLSAVDAMRLADGEHVARVASRDGVAVADQTDDSAADLLAR